MWLEAKQATEAYETSAQLCAHRGNTMKIVLSKLLSKTDPIDLWITLSQSSDIFSNKGWRDCPSPLTIIVPCVISSTMTSTDRSLPQTTVAYMYFSCLWNTAPLMWLHSVFACGREESHQCSLRWKFYSVGMSSPVPVEIVVWTCSFRFPR